MPIQEEYYLSAPFLTSIRIVLLLKKRSHRFRALCLGCLYDFAHKKVSPIEKYVLHEQDERL